MRKYPAEHWKVVGQWIHDLRLMTPYSDTKAWAEKVGRSDRVLLGLERGEPVGPKTIDAVAAGLGIRSAELFAALATGQKPTELHVVGDMREFIAEYMPGYIKSFDEFAASGKLGPIKLPDGTTVGGAEDAGTYVASPGERVAARESDDVVLQAIVEMRRAVDGLSERVARLEQQGSKPVGGTSGPV